MRTRPVLAWCCAGLLLAACGSEAGAGGDTAVTATAAETRLVVVSSEPGVPLTTIAPNLVDDCVGYVPFAASNGNFYMHVIWDMAGQDLAALRGICEEMGHTDPAGLQRISEEKQAVDRYFASLSTSTTVAAAPPPPAAGAVTIPAGPSCPEGSVMTPTGHCQATTP